MVKCEICQREFKVISPTHLRTHDLSMEAYRTKFPDAKLVSEESLEKVKAASSLNNQKRKGVKRSAEDMAAIRAGIAAVGPRIAHNKGVAMTDDQKAHLSKVAKEGFANGTRNHGGNYERTPEIRKKISEIVKQNYKGKEHSRQYISKRITESNLFLRNSITDDLFDLQCLKCNTCFNRNYTMFHSSNYHTKLCPYCFPKTPISQAENDVACFVSDLINEPIRRSDKMIISPLELDIVVPTRSIAIEYCGIYWHSELQGKPSWYHRKKLDLCREKSIRLLTIFEDEWVIKRQIVESMLSNTLGRNTKKINARMCEVKEIDSHVGNLLIEQNHIQGRGRANIYYGLYYDDELVSVMSFSNNELSRRSRGWDINRYCSLLNTSIRGGASKLFNKFISEHNPQQVISYADLRWGTGNVYGKLGFRHIGDTVPNYWYFREGLLKRHHRFGLRKNSDDDPNMTEWQNRQEQGWNRIWDCGSSKWEWQNGK